MVESEKKKSIKAYNNVQSLISIKVDAKQITTGWHSANKKQKVNDSKREKVRESKKMDIGSMKSSKINESEIKKGFTKLFDI